MIMLSKHSGYHSHHISIDSFLDPWYLLTPLSYKMFLVISAVSEDFRWSTSFPGCFLLPPVFSRRGEEKKEPRNKADSQWIVLV